MKRTGIILELNENQAVVMANDAEFITIKREPEMVVGAPVELNPAIHSKFAFFQFGNPLKSLRTAGLVGLTVTAVFCLAFTFFLNGPFRHHQNPYAYVTVDINPSVELILDTKITITEVRNINEDAQLLLQGKSLLHMPLTQALLTLVNRAEQKNYFASTTERYILVATATENIAVGKLKLLETSISQCNTELGTRNIQMQYIQATLAERKTALENHLSTGRYALMTYAQEAGQEIGLETAKTETVGRLLASSGLLANSADPLVAAHSKNATYPRDTNKIETKGAPNSALGTPNVQPNNLAKQSLTASNQNKTEKATPTLSNPFIVSGGSTPISTANTAVTVTPKLYLASAEDTRLAASIASAYQINVSGQDINRLREDQSLGYGEIGLLYSLANAAGKTITDILTRRQSGLSWNEIAESLGLKISEITRKNSAVLKKAELAKEDQKIKALIKQEEKEKKERERNNQATSKPTKEDPGKGNGNPTSSGNGSNGGNGGSNGGNGGNSGGNGGNGGNGGGHGNNK